MQNMEDLEVSKDDADNNVEVVVEKVEYEHQRDANVVSITYLLKPLEDMSRQLYVHSTLNMCQSSNFCYNIFWMVKITCHLVGFKGPLD